MRRLTWMLLALLLTGCITAGKRGGDSALTLYDLGPSAQRETPRSRNAPMAVEVRAPIWFDALGINYRLSYSEPARLREYARARWVGPPAQLIQLRLSRDLNLIPAGQGKAPCVLRVDIEEFSQVFDQPTVSRGVLQGRVRWLDAGRNQLAEDRINIETAAASADSRGGVAALTTAVETLITTIGRREDTLVGSGKLRHCQR